MKRLTLLMSALVWLSCAKDNEPLSDAVEKSDVSSLQTISVKTTADGVIQGKLKDKTITFEVAQIPSEVTVESAIPTHEAATTNRKKGSKWPITDGKSTISVIAENGNTTTYNVVFLAKGAMITALRITIGDQTFTAQNNAFTYTVSVPDLQEGTEVTISTLSVSQGAKTNIGSTPYKFTTSSQGLKIEVTSSTGVTNVYTLNVIKKPKTVTKRVVLEEFSGQRCPNCPTGYNIVKKLLIDYPDNFVSVNIQAGPLSTADLKIEDGQKLWDYFRIPNQPQAVIDRKDNKKIFSTGSWASEVKAQIDQGAIVAIDANVSLNDRNLTAEISLDFSQAVSEELKIIGYITENNIIAFQANAGNSYSHQHVLRSIATNSHLGDKIEGNSFATNQTYTHTISTTVPSGVKVANAQLVIILAKVSNDEALNALEKKLQ